ncbi:MAG: glycoside hydrolase family 3 N-terminal domain-containing protein, partial [Candidatus Dormiibacterota bacterium]
MSRGRRLAQLGLVVVVALLAGMILIGRPAAPKLAAALAVPTASPSPSPTPIASPTPDLGNLDDDIGSIMVVSTQGTDISPTLSSLLTDGKVGGLLLFGSNFGSSPAGLRAWSDRLQAIASSACLDHPILLMTDEEGGQVTQVRAGFAPPSELVMG